MLTVAILAPVLPRGFVLVYDMSFVPRQPLLPDSLGLGGGLPRAVPADALVAAATTVIPGDVLQKLILLGTLFAAGLGAARLVPGGLLAQCVAAVAYPWNAFLAERLLIGHWGLLVAYAALPWVVKTARDLAEGRGRWGCLVLATVPAVITPTGGLLAAGAALAVAGRRRALGVAGIAAVLNAPWWLPAVLHSGAGTSDPDGVAAFAARGEGWAGPVLSVLGLGGIWNAEVAPASRDNPVLPLFTLLIVGLAGWGVWRLLRRWGSPARGLALLAGAGLVVAVAGSVPGLAAGLEWMVAHLPGAGLLRDGQKWAAWWALLLALGFALGSEALADLSRDRLRDGRLAAAAIGVGALLLPVAILPDLAWGAAGRLRPVLYPADWQRVSDILARDERPGDVLTAPLSAYRRFAWNAGRTQYDPAPRHLPRPTVVADSLKVGPVVVRGEDARAARVEAAAARGEPLGRHGIGWVLIEHRTPGPPVDTTHLTRVYAGDWLTLYRVEGRVADPPGWSAATPWVLTADAVAVLLVLVSALSLRLPSGRLMASRRRAVSRDVTSGG